MLSFALSITGTLTRLFLPKNYVCFNEVAAVRLIFDVITGPAIGAFIMCMGNRFCNLTDLVGVVPTDQPLPNFPVARALWVPHPNLQVAAAAWIYAGGAPHTGFS